jgi:hypothetical protein
MEQAVLEQNSSQSLPLFQMKFVISQKACFFFLILVHPGQKGHNGKVEESHNLCVPFLCKEDVEIVMIFGFLCLGSGLGGGSLFSWSAQERAGE